MRIALGEFFGIGKVDINAGNIRIEADGLQIGLLRLLQLAELFEHVAHIVVGIGKVGLERKRAAVKRARRAKVAAFERNPACQIHRIVIVGIERQHALIGGRGFVDFLLVEQHGGVVHGEADFHQHQIRVEPDQRVVVCDGAALCPQIAGESGLVSKHAARGQLRRARQQGI
jgi:hypothetical protein